MLLGWIQVVAVLPSPCPQVIQTRGLELSAKWEQFLEQQALVSELESQIAVEKLEEAVEGLSGLQKRSIMEVKAYAKPLKYLQTVSDQGSREHRCDHMD